MHKITTHKNNPETLVRRFLGTFLGLLISMPSARSASIHTQRLEDPKAVYLNPPSGGDDTRMLQQAIDKVQETTRQGIVMIGPGRYRLSDTVHVWPGIRVIGYGATRPVIVLPSNTSGFQDPEHEKVLLFFAGNRPSDPSGTVQDANPGTFYSAISNIDIEIEGENPGAVAVRARYAQHCFLAHMELRLGSALAGIHEGGNVVEDVRFIGGRYGIWTSKPSPSWQFTVIDSVFEGQREAAIREREAGLTLIRPHFLRVPTAVALEPGQADELWIKDARLEDISGPAFLFGVEKNPRNEINMENVTCRSVPVFAAMRESGRQFKAPAEIYQVDAFSHGLEFSDLGAEPEITTRFDAKPLAELPAPAASDLIPLPPQETWVNVRDLGAKGDARTDDTAAIQNAIAAHRTIYFPTGCYIVRDTLSLRPDTVLVGLHPGATQIILPDETPAFQGDGGPKALVETPRGGTNIVIGLGLYTNGANPRAVAALWKAGERSMMNDVRFLGGHGTPNPDGSRQNPYNADHSADPDPKRRWNSQYPSLWVTDGGGGTFLDIWTPSTFASAGMMISDTETEGRVYQMSSEHHAQHEVRIHNAANWSLYALQTESERGESGASLPLEIKSSRNITVANLHIYRVISSFQPHPCAVTVTDSRDIRFRNFHCYSNSKVNFDVSILDPALGVAVSDHEFARLDISGNPPKPAAARESGVIEPGCKVEKLAGGFFNISGGAAGPGDDFFFVDSHKQRIHRWDHAGRKLSTPSEQPIEPVNLAVDQAGNLMVVSMAGKGVVYSLTPSGETAAANRVAASPRDGATFFLPTSDWILNREALAHPAAHFISPDGGTIVPAAAGFLNGETSWGVKSSPQIRSFGLSPARAGQTFYVTDESGISTWAANVGTDGSLTDFRLFANMGGESVAVDSQGNVYIAAGRIHVYNPDGKLLERIDVPERPLQLVFGGNDGKTLFIPARTSLYSVRMRHPGR